MEALPEWATHGSRLLPFRSVDGPLHGQMDPPRLKIREVHPRIGGMMVQARKPIGTPRGEHTRGSFWMGR